MGTMKLYKPPVIKVIRVTITRPGFKNEHLTVCDTTLVWAYNAVKRCINSKKVSPFCSITRTSITLREGEGTLNGQSMSMSFVGMDPAATKELIEEYIDRLNRRKR